MFVVQGLNERYRGIADAHRWLQANRGRFRGPVYGPLAVEVRASQATARVCSSLPAVASLETMKQFSPPALLQVECPDPLHLQYLEQQVGGE